MLTPARRRPGRPRGMAAMSDRLHLLGPANTIIVLIPTAARMTCGGKFVLDLKRGAVRRAQAMQR